MLCGIVVVGALIAAIAAPAQILALTAAMIAISAFMVFYTKTPDEIGLGSAMRRAIAGSVVLSYLVFLCLVTLSPSLQSVIGASQDLLDSLTNTMIAVIVFYFGSEAVSALSKTFSDRASAATDQAIINATQDAVSAKRLKSVVSPENEAATTARQQADAARISATNARHNANLVEDRLSELEALLQPRRGEDLRTAFDRHVAAIVQRQVDLSRPD
jgi:hypothetical protein